MHRSAALHPRQARIQDKESDSSAGKPGTAGTAVIHRLLLGCYLRGPSAPAHRVLCGKRLAACVRFRGHLERQPWFAANPTGRQPAPLARAMATFVQEPMIWPFVVHKRLRWPTHGGEVLLLGRNVSCNKALVAGHAIGDCVLIRTQSRSAGRGEQCAHRCGSVALASDALGALQVCIAMWL